MLLPLYGSIPTNEYINSKVVVYSHGGRWEPIMTYQFEKAIALCRNAYQQGKELFIFPVDFKLDAS